MQFTLIQKFLPFILFLISSYSLYGQTNLCKNIYVWDFKNPNGKIDKRTKILTNEIEDILTQIAECKILQRRNYKEIQQQAKNESQILSREGIPKDLLNKLDIIQAKRVLFGEVEEDYSFNVGLRLSLENLKTKEIKTISVLIPASTMIEKGSRKILLESTIDSLLNTDLSTNEIKEIKMPSVIYSFFSIVTIDTQDSLTNENDTKIKHRTNALFSSTLTTEDGKIYFFTNNYYRTEKRINKNTNRITAKFEPHYFSEVGKNYINTDYIIGKNISELSKIKSFYVCSYCLFENRKEILSKNAKIHIQIIVNGIEVFYKSFFNHNIKEYDIFNNIHKIRINTHNK